MPKLTPEILLIAALLNLLLYGFFCFSLYRALRQVKPQNQKINISYVWLMMIPIIQWAANFYVVPRLSDSIQAELEDRNFEMTERPAYNAGITYAVASIVVNILFAFLPVAAGLFGIVVLILMIQYWNKVNWYRKVLENDLQDNANN